MSGFLASCSRAFGSLSRAHQSSPSRKEAISPCISGMPTLNAEAWPPLGLKRYRTRGANLRTIADVLSADPSSTTITSISAADSPCSSTLTSACSIKRSWLYVSIRTLTKGLVMPLLLEAQGVAACVADGQHEAQGETSSCLAGR